MSFRAIARNLYIYKVVHLQSGNGSCIDFSLSLEMTGYFELYLFINSTSYT